MKMKITKEKIFLKDLCHKKLKKIQKLEEKVLK